MYDEQARTNKPKNDQAQRRNDFWDEHGQVTKLVYIFALTKCGNGYLQNKSIPMPLSSLF